MPAKDKELALFWQVLNPVMLAVNNFCTILWFGPDIGVRGSEELDHKVENIFFVHHRTNII